MRSFGLFIILLIVGFSSVAKQPSDIKRPKIVVGLVVDQMRWDYLYRYYDLYGNDGFKRLMNGGFNCQNTMINYLPSFTAPGHSCIYTGSVPAIHGIAGNEWVDNRTGRPWYCVEDTSVSLVGDESKARSMSPRNLLTTTITDELRLATNMRSRVYGVAIKDRSSILPAGHLANAAYWYNEKTGNFTTSTYYSNQNPAWLQAFNKRRVGDSLLKNGWRLLYDEKVYEANSTADANNYERPFKGEKTPVFPHTFDSIPAKNRNSIIKSTPAGNTYSFLMAKACMDGEQLGMGRETDFMALSLSSTDYVGHQFGTNSIEIEDTYLRLDRDIADFLTYLDAKYGVDGYLFFLTADHGGAHNVTFLQEHDVPAGVLYANLKSDMNAHLKKQFGKDSLVVSIDNYQVSLNNLLIDKNKYDKAKVKQSIIQLLNKRPEVSYVVDMENMDKTPLPEPIRSMVVNGYNVNRSGVIQIILNPAWYDNEGKPTGMTHGSWNPYDVHIPLIWYGWNIANENLYKVLNMTDISATIASLLHIQMPNGCVGKPITEVIK